MEPRNRTWGPVLTWVGVALIEVHAVAVGYAFIALVLGDGLPIWEAVRYAPLAIIYLSIGALLALAVAIPTMYTWARVVRRAPWLEASWRHMLLSLILLASALSLLLGAVSSWEAIVYPDHPEPFIRTSFEIALIVAPWTLIGMVLPRFTVPSLGPGAFGIRAPVV